MEIQSLFGLPAHPLIVHAAVVLLPLAAICTVVTAAVPRTRRHFAPGHGAKRFRSTAWPPTPKR